MGRGSANSLAPGFRFHPTDEELVRYYLKRKVCNKPFRLDAISVVDVYKSEPWDLPDKSKLKGRDLEWYFFTVLDKKYGNGSKTNRATEKGYWKTTGKDREIRKGPRVVGMKKTLVYHKGRAPRGERTNWVMHEYRLVDEELQKAGVPQDAFVICRIFQKSGSGPKNGEKYGAPFVEEEWEEDDTVLVTGHDSLTNEIFMEEDAFLDVNEIDQNVGIDGAYENTTMPSSFYYGESSNCFEADNYAEADNYIVSHKYVECSEEDQKPIIRTRDNQAGPDLPDEQVCDLPELNGIDLKFPKEEYQVDSCDIDSVSNNFLLGEPYLDASDNPPLGNGLCLEGNDLSDIIGGDGFELDEYLTFFDADNYDPLNVNSSQPLKDVTSFPDQAPLTQEQQLNGDLEQTTVDSKHLLSGHIKDEASCSDQKESATKFDSDAKYPFMKQASQMIGGIHGPPAFASEFSTKGAAIQPSSSVRVTAGMVRITNTSFDGTGIYWPAGKNQDIDIAFTFGLLQRDPNSSISAGKTDSMVHWGLVVLMFFWVFILSVSFKISTCISAM